MFIAVSLLIWQLYFCFVPILYKFVSLQMQYRIQIGREYYDYIFICSNPLSFRFRIGGELYIIKSKNHIHKTKIVSPSYIKTKIVSCVPHKSSFNHILNNYKQKNACWPNTFPLAFNRITRKPNHRWVTTSTATCW